MRKCATTGLVVDIRGEGQTGQRPADDKIAVVALRADMDALRMTERNTNLPYRSSNEGVAQCGTTKESNLALRGPVALADCTASLTAPHR